jgi:hypothetical protein
MINYLNIAYIYIVFFGKIMHILTLFLCYKYSLIYLYCIFHNCSYFSPRKFLTKISFKLSLIGKGTAPYVVMSVYSSVYDVVSA